MKAEEVKKYWESSMVLSGKAAFANLEYYLRESGDVGLTLLNANAEQLKNVINVQRLTLEMKKVKTVVENKKYFLGLAEKELIKVKQILRAKFDQTYRLLAQNGYDVANLTEENLFEYIEKMNTPEPQPEPQPGKVKTKK